MDGWAFMILPFAALLTGNKSAERKKDPNYGVYNLVCVCAVVLSPHFILDGDHNDCY